MFQGQIMSVLGQWKVGIPLVPSPPHPAGRVCPCGLQMGLTGTSGLTVAPFMYSRGQKLLGVFVREPHKRKPDIPEKGGCLKTQSESSFPVDREVDETKCFPLLRWVWSHKISPSQSCFLVTGRPRDSLTCHAPS